MRSLSILPALSVCLTGLECSAIAIYHKRITDYVSDEQTVQEHWTQAAHAFLEAAKAYPADDEHHVRAYHLYFVTITGQALILHIEHLGFAIDALVNCTDATVRDLTGHIRQHRTAVARGQRDMGAICFSAGVHDDARPEVSGNCAVGEREGRAGRTARRGQR